MHWFLVPWLLIAGEWTRGLPEDGWAPIKQPDAITCYRKADEANERNKGLPYKFTCEHEPKGI